MENQNIQWENWDNQPQQEQPQQTWGEHPQQEQPPRDWSTPPQQEQPFDDNKSEEPILTNEELVEYELNQFIDDNSTFLGNTSNITISTDLYQINIDNQSLLEEILKSNLDSLGDNRFRINLESNTKLEELLSLINLIGKKQGLKLSNFNLYKVPSGESVLNIFKGKPKKNFVYFVKCDYYSGDVIIDLSSIGGPSTKSLTTSQSILSIIPGWVPFRISKNESKNEFIAIAGSFV